MKYVATVLKSSIIIIQFKKNTKICSILFSVDLENDILKMLSVALSEVPNKGRNK